MMPLVFSLWREVLESTIDKDHKLVAIGAVLQVYAGLLGMTDEDFQYLTHQIGEAYSGPLPDGYSQQVLDHYKELKKHG